MLYGTLHLRVEKISKRFSQESGGSAKVIIIYCGNLKNIPQLGECNERFGLTKFFFSRRRIF